MSKIDTSWISILINSHGGLGAQWARDIGIRKEQVPADQLREELIWGVGLLLSNYRGTTHDDDHDGRHARYRRSLLDILEYDPTLMGGMTMNWEMAVGMLQLSMEGGGSGWLGKSGADIVGALRICMLDRRMGFLLEEDSDGLPKMERWLAADPTHERAWKSLQQEDRAHYDRHGAWFDTWVGDGKDPPLLGWCREIADGKATQKCPLTDAGLTQGQKEKDIQSMRTWAAEKYQKLLNNNISGIWFQGIANLNASIARDAQRMTSTNTQWRELSEFPAEALIQSLALGKDSGWRAMGSPEGAARFQALCQQDRRVAKVVGLWDMRVIVQWMLKESSWIAWKDPKGRSLLDLGLDERKWVGSAHVELRVGKADLRRLAKQDPDLLTGTNDHGESVLDRLHLPDATRADVKRAIMARHIQPERRASKPKGRAL